MTQAILTFLGGLVAGYIVAYFQYVFDAEKSRLDFKTKILREVWEAVLFAKSLATNLDPDKGFVDLSEPREKRVERRLAEFGEAAVKAKRVVRFNSPFYPVPIHDLANKIVIEAELLARHVANESPATMQHRYWERVEESTDKLNELIEPLCEAIRREANRPSLNPFGRLQSSRNKKRPAVETAGRLQQ